MSIFKNKDFKYFTQIAVFFSLFIYGCSPNIDGEKSLETALAPHDNLITNSVNDANQILGIDNSDALIVKNSVASTNPDYIELPITWQNSDTEATGKIVSIKHFTGKHGQKCKSFRTTVNNYQGSAFYDGETCQINKQDWALTWFKAIDG